MRTAIYLRVSTAHQTVENQRGQLEQFCTVRGWAITKTYQDEGISGDAASRPGFEQMLTDAQKGQFETILVFQLSRLGRSLNQIVQVITELTNAKVSVYSMTEHISTLDDNPYAKVTLAIFAALAEVELGLIRERVRSGVKRAQAQGVRFGRPHKGFDLGQAVQLRNSGLSLRRIAKNLGIATSTLSARFAEMQSVQKVATVNGL